MNVAEITESLLKKNTDTIVKTLVANTTKGSGNLEILGLKVTQAHLKTLYDHIRPQITALNVYKITPGELKELLESGFDVNTRFYRGLTLAHYYCNSWSAPHLEVILAFNPDLDATDNDGLTPLDHVYDGSLIKDRDFRLKWLSEHSRMFDMQRYRDRLETRIKWDRKERALSLGIMKEDTPISLGVTTRFTREQEKLIKKIMSKGLKDKYMHDITPEVLREILEKGFDVNSKIIDRQGQTLAHYYCELEKPTYLKVVLEFKPDITIKDETGRIPLDYSLVGETKCRRCLELLNRYEGVDEIERSLRLFQRGSHAEFDACLKTLDKFTPEQLVRFLDTTSFRRGSSSIDDMTFDGLPLLHYFCKSGKPKHLERFIRSDTDLKLKDGSGKTAFNYLVELLQAGPSDGQKACFEIMVKVMLK